MARFGLPITEANRHLANLYQAGLTAEVVGGVHKGHSKVHDIDLISSRSDLDRNKQIIRSYKKENKGVGPIDLYVPDSDDQYDKLRHVLRSPTYDVINKRMGMGLRYRRITLADPSYYSPSSIPVVPVAYPYTGLSSSSLGSRSIILPSDVLPLVLLGKSVYDLISLRKIPRDAIRNVQIGLINAAPKLVYDLKYGLNKFSECPARLIVYRMGKKSAALLKWRRKQPRGAIMKPSTFEKIKKKAMEAGYDNPEAVAGAAYWNTAEAKFKNRNK